MKLREKKLLGVGILIMFVKAMPRPQKFLISSCGFVAPKSSCLKIKESYENVNFTSSLKEATKDSAIVTTDVWISMGDEKESAKRKNEFRNYQVNEKVLDEAFFRCNILTLFTSQNEVKKFQKICSTILEAVFGIKPKIDFMHKKVFF